MLRNVNMGVATGSGHEHAGVLTITVTNAAHHACALQECIVHNVLEGHFSFTPTVAGPSIRTHGIRVQILCSLTHY
jgi:hypothetical protein